MNNWARDDFDSDDELVFFEYDRGNDALLSDPENMFQCPLWNGAEQTGISSSHDEKLALHFSGESDPQETVPTACRPRRQSAEVAKARFLHITKPRRSETRRKKKQHSYTESPAAAQNLEIQDDFVGALDIEIPTRQVSVVFKIAGVIVGKECPATMLISSNKGKRSHAQKIDASKKQCMHEDVIQAPIQIKTPLKISKQQNISKQARSDTKRYLCRKCGHTCLAKRKAAAQSKSRVGHSSAKKNSPNTQQQPSMGDGLNDTAQTLTFAPEKSTKQQLPHAHMEMVDLKKLVDTTLEGNEDFGPEMPLQNKRSRAAFETPLPGKEALSKADVPLPQNKRPKCVDSTIKKIDLASSKTVSFDVLGHSNPQHSQLHLPKLDAVSFESSLPLHVEGLVNQEDLVNQVAFCRHSPLLVPLPLSNLSPLLN